MRFTGTSIWRESSAARDANLAQFFGKMLAGVDGSAGHDALPSMTINDLDIHGAGRSFRPPKTDPPLIVDANRKLSGTPPFEGFQPVARQCRQIGEARRRLQTVKTHLGLPREARELPDMSSSGKPFGGLVPITDDHGIGITGFMIYVNSKSGLFGACRLRRRELALK